MAFLCPHPEVWDPELGPAVTRGATGSVLLLIRAFRQAPEGAALRQQEPLGELSLNPAN